MYNPSKQTWLNPNIEYLFNEEITEYDIHDAGFSIIKQFDLLPKETISWLNNLNKGTERHIAIGKLQRDYQGLSESLGKKFTEVRRAFIQTNDLSDDDIVSVKKDAIFTTKSAKRTNFGQIHFMPKNRYTSYIRFPSNHNIEIYYSGNDISIKGMGDIAIKRHNLYMIDTIRDVIKMIENGDQKVKRYIIDFTEKYKRHELDQEFYIEMNNISRDYNIRYNYENVVIPLVMIILKEI